MPLTEEQQRLAADNIHLARRIARPYKTACPRLRDDIESAAMLGLLYAATRYDSSLGFAFSTCAWSRIRGTVLNVIRFDCGGLGGASAMCMSDRRPRCLTTPNPGNLKGSRPLACGSIPRVAREMLDADAVDDIVRKLPAKHAKVLKAIALGGLSQQETAARLNCSQTEVSRLIRESRQLLAG